VWVTFWAEIFLKDRCFNIDSSMFDGFLSQKVTELKPFLRGEIYAFARAIVGKPGSACGKLWAYRL